jgi:hypothetical protein
MGRVAGRFARVQLRRRAKALVRGLLCDLPGKRCWTIAEQAGQATPDGCSTCWPGRGGTTTPCALTCPPCWLSTWATKRRCWWWMRPGPQDGQPHRRGAAPGQRHRRQGRQRPGRRLAGLRHRGRARADRPRAVPAQGWLADPAGLPGSPPSAGLPPSPSWPGCCCTRAGGWGAGRLGDRRCGLRQPPGLRGWLETAGCPRCWRQGHRAAAATVGAPRGWARWLLVRRSLGTGELASYRPGRPALVALVRVAGCRWQVEESFQASKGRCGLDQHQLRRSAPGIGG